MSDLMKKETRGKLAIGASGISGGIGILLLTGYVAGHFIPALVIGALVLWGSWRLFQKPNSALVGMVGLAAGVLVAASGIPIVGHLASLLLGISGIGLLIGGGLTVWQVMKGRRS
jgi:hypothetical protein